MRLDTRVDPRERTINVLATLNGRVVAHCVAADEEEGWVEFVVMRDARYHGKGVIFDDNNQMITARAHGKVAIVPSSQVPKHPECSMVELTEEEIALCDTPVSEAVWPKATE